MTVTTRIRAAREKEQASPSPHDDASLQRERDDTVHQAAMAAASAPAPSRVRRRRAVPASESSPGGGARLRRSGGPSSALLEFEALPSFLRDNEFIKTGYRYDLPMKDTLRSLFNLHNETGNVWSHLIGFVLFLVLTVWMVNSPPTPLLLAKPHLDELWGSVQEHLHVMRARGMDQLPRLAAGASQQLQQALAETVQNLVVHPLQDSWQSGVHHLQESVYSLQESVHSLQDRVQTSAQHLAEQLQHKLLVLLHEGRSAAGGAVTHLHLPPALLTTLAHGLHWPTARWPMYVFCAGTMSCLLLSALCHLFGCCKKHVSLFIWRLDYTGISLLIVSSFYPAVYYSFLCRPTQAAVYLVSITVLGAATVAMSLLECFQKSAWRSTRAGLYACLGLCGVVPLVHIMTLHSDVWHVRNFVAADMLMGVSYLTGAVIYIMRVPERWFPGKFDLLLHSHQIFHVCVVLGAYLHWRAALLLLEWRDASGGCAVLVTEGPLRSVVEGIRSQGHELLGVDQVWEGLRAAVAEHLHHFLSGTTLMDDVGTAAVAALPGGGQGTAAVAAVLPGGRQGAAAAAAAAQGMAGDFDTSPVEGMGWVPNCTAAVCPA